MFPSLLPGIRGSWLPPATEMLLNVPLPLPGNSQAKVTGEQFTANKIPGGVYLAS